MALNLEDAVRVEMKTRWKRKLHLTFYTFLCSDCGKEVDFRKYETKRVDVVRCRKCAAILNGQELIKRNGIEPYRALYNGFVGQAKLRNKDCTLTF